MFFLLLDTIVGQLPMMTPVRSQFLGHSMFLVWCQLKKAMWVCGLLLLWIAHVYTYLEGYDVI